MTSVYEDLTSEVSKGLEFFVKEAQEELAHQEPTVRNVRWGEVQEQLQVYRNELTSMGCPNTLLLDAIDRLMGQVQEAITPDYDPNAASRLPDINMRIVGLQVAAYKGPNYSF